MSKSSGAAPAADYFSTAPGSYLTLSLGRVHYRLLAPSSGAPQRPELVVALHGINAEGEAWLPLAERLTAEGYTVLLPDF